MGQQTSMVEPILTVKSNGLKHISDLADFCEQAGIESEFQGCPDCLENSASQYRLPFDETLMVINRNDGKGWQLEGYEPLEKIDCKCKED